MFWMEKETTAGKIGKKDRTSNPYRTGINMAEVWVICMRTSRRWTLLGGVHSSDGNVCLGTEVTSSHSMACSEPLYSEYNNE